MRGLHELDRVLRGDATAPPALVRDGGLRVAFGPLVRVNLLLAATYGLCMGFFGVFNRPEPEFRQLLADVVKVPALFILTLIVTFPSLYVFNALVGSRLNPTALARLMAAALGVLLAVLAALGPIVAFFSVTTTSYPFVVLLNVAVFAVAGGFGLAFLLQTLDKLTRLPDRPAEDSRLTPAARQEGARPEGATPDDAATPVLPARGMNVTTVFRVWLVMFALVGAQMSWVLRPFIGSPDREFTWFRPREASFLEAVAKSARMLLGTDSSYDTPSRGR